MRPPTTIVVMGVTASGKSTVMAALAAALDWPTGEGDDMHPAANIEKMRAGLALGDDDRWPWLEAIADWIGVQEAAGRSSIVSCSALRRVYRDCLRRGHGSVWFAHLALSRDGLEARLADRSSHFMAPSLLGSQLDTLEPLGPDEPGATFDADAPVPAIASRIVRALGLTAADTP
jgi:gluconokinase